MWKVMCLNPRCVNHQRHEKWCQFLPCLPLGIVRLEQNWSLYCWVSVTKYSQPYLDPKLSAHFLGPFNLLQVCCGDTRGSSLSCGQMWRKGKKSSDLMAIKKQVWSHRELAAAHRACRVSEMDTGMARDTGEKMNGRWLKLIWPLLVAIWL